MLELKKIKKSYKTADFVQVALKEINLKFRKNEFVAILGPSGSGKTTLLNIIGGLDHYDEGDISINHLSTKKFKDNDWDAYRNRCIGFIFQNYNLISHISVLDNVEIGMVLSGVSVKKRKKQAKKLLKEVGLEKHMYKRPNQLSGGQMQRVAIARALANNPDIILADEPTGALDTKTSVQILELMKEMAKDKLVIMVTHNPALAKTYANRVIEMQDGEIIGDSNPVQEIEPVKTTYQRKKTNMHFLTALKLSLNNIKTKKGRTFITAFASSIGIIGIASILSLSNGFDHQIALFEKSTVSAMPIIVSNQTTNIEEEIEQEDIKEYYPDTPYIYLEKKKNHKTNERPITKEYVEYIENIDSSFISGISYTYYTNLNVFNKIDGRVKKLDLNASFTTIQNSLEKQEKSLVTEQYDILAGKEAKEKEELMLIVDSQNRITEDLLENLGNFENKTPIAFEDLLNKEIKLVLNEDYYTKIQNFYTTNTDLENLYNSKKALTLKIVGIIRLKKEYPSDLSTPSLVYTDKLLNYVIEQNKNSSIVKDQRKKNYNVLTGEQFDLNTQEGKEAKEQMLAFLGEDSIPYSIQLYPKDFSTKEKLLAYLDQYNGGKEMDKQVFYVDQAKMITSLSGNVMDAIAIVLVAFSAISLIVSSIMIGIIMYISVLERTKEIGILRSLGARKKDISRVFNAETFIIGLSAGILGIFITCFLLVLINQILYQLTDIENIAILNPLHAISLIFMSLFLTLIGGKIPAKIASKKDPVVALRTE